MSASQAEKTWLRTRLGSNESAMPDRYIDDLFADALGEYPGKSRQIIKQVALVQGWDDLIARAVVEHDYTEGDASVKRSQIVANLRNARALAADKLQGLLTKSRQGGTFHAPLRRRSEYKDKPTHHG